MRGWSVVLAVSAAVFCGRVANGVVLQPDEPSAKDVFVYQAFPDGNNNSGPFAGVLGTAESATVHDTYTLIEFDLGSVPFTAAEVTSATLSLFVLDGNALTGGNNANPSPSFPAPTEAWAADSAWNEGTVTWNTRPATTGPVVDTIDITGVNAYVSFTVTDLVKDWLDGSLANNGFLLKQTNPVFDPGINREVAVFYGSSASTAKPYLTVLPEPGSLAFIALGGVVALRARGSEGRRAEG